MSPELFKYKPYSYKSDIWALGCIMYEICNLKHAFDAQNLNGLAIKILKGNFTPMNSQYSKQLRTLVESMLNTKPANRPTIEEILSKPFIKKKLVGYVIYLFQHEQQDYDLYLDTVRLQCKSLGIWELVEKYMNKKVEKLSNSDFMGESLGGKKPSLREQKQDQEAKLRQALGEQDKIDEELKKLESVKSSKEFAAMGNREKVLFLKKMKKLSDLSEKNHQLEDIRRSNQDSSFRNKKAGDKNRDSKQVKHLIGNKGMQVVEEFDDEDFEDPDNLKQIREEDEEEDIDERIKKYKQRKENNSQNIESLREELKKTTQKYQFLIKTKLRKR